MVNQPTSFPLSMFSRHGWTIPRAFAVVLLLWAIWGLGSAITDAARETNSPWIPDSLEQALDQKAIAISLSWRLVLLVAAYSLNWICFSGRNIEGYAIALFLAGCAAILLILKPINVIPDATPLIGEIDNTGSKFVAGACMVLATLASWRTYRRNQEVDCAARGVIASNGDASSVRRLLIALGHKPPDHSSRQ